MIRAVQSVKAARPARPWLTGHEFRVTIAYCLLTLVLAGADVLTTGFPLVGVLAIPILLAGLDAGVRGTAIVFALAATLAALAGFTDHFFGSLDHVSRFLTVVGAGVIAVYIAASRERTERAEAGRELNRAILDSVLDNAPVGVALINSDLRFLIVNEAMANSSGRSPDDHIGLTPQQVSPQLERIEAPIRQVLETEQPILGVELATPAQSGDRREWLANYYPVRLPSGELLGVGTTMIDITQRKAAERALREGEERLRMALDSSRTAAWEWEIDTNTLTASPNIGDVYGIAPEEPAGREIYEAAIHPDDREIVTQMRLDAVATGDDFGAEFRVIGEDGGTRWIELRGHVLSVDDRPRKLVGIVVDITARKRQEDAIRFLAEASAILDSTLDLDRLLGELARLAVPAIADGCMVDLLERGTLRRAALAGAGNQAAESLARLQQHTPDLEGDHPIAIALRTGETQHLEQIGDGEKLGWAQSAEYQSALKRFPVKSALIVPIKAGSHVLGTIGLPSFHDPQAFDQLRIWVAEELAARAAVAISNVRMYEERAKIAETLQRSLLPPQLPVVEGLDLAASYRAGGEGVEVGGDFYDVFEIGGRWCILIGDVSGKGAAAAAATSLARYTTRGMMVNELDPSEALTAVNDVLCAQFGSHQFCTMVCATMGIEQDHVSVEMTLAGHPQPVVLRADSRIEVAGEPGTLLGAIDEPLLRNSRLQLRSGDTLLLYTDGITEMPTGADRRLEQDGLVSLLEKWRGRGAAQLIDHLERELEKVRAGAERDDAAMLVVQLPAGPGMKIAAGARGRSEQSAPALRT